ncbi:MAG: isoprenylcysteine carboxylmethyltransferase family protein [Anaerolineae bacterium]|nr:isoprenylcysteine carboxylmethyltransferase family protein [Anaerolineae bacterium]
MSTKDLVSLAHALAGASSMVASVMAKGQIAIPQQAAKSLGLGVFAAGCLLFAWSLVHLRAAFGGNVDPVTDRLVTTGPFRIVRHPTYLAMLVMAFGLALALRSVLGMAVAAVVFIPFTIYRARLEEQSLEERFGDVWKAYRSTTHFMLPLIY